MRKILTLLPILLVLTLVGCSKKKSNDIPSDLTQTFSSKYPKAQKVSWHKINQFEYRASFMVNGKKMKATFSEDGGVLSTEKQINKNKLPKGVMSSVTQNYKKSEISEVFKITNKKGTQYQVVVNKNGKKSKMTYDEDGDMIQQGS